MEANILRILVILIGIALVAVIMLQQPKEGGMGAFTGGGGGSGASSTVFGAKGSGSFLFRLTGGLILALTIVIVMLVKVSNSNLGGSVLSSETVTEKGDIIPGSSSEKTTEETILGENKTEDNVPGASNLTPADEEGIPGAKNNGNTPDEIEAENAQPKTGNNDSDSVELKTNSMAQQKNVAENSLSKTAEAPSIDNKEMNNTSSQKTEKVE